MSPLHLPQRRDRVAQARRSLASRLTALSLWAAGLALVVAGLALNGAMFVLELRSLRNEATAQASVIAANAAAALLFSDRGAAAETLATLERAPRVARATLYDTRRQFFTEYQRGDQAWRQVPPLDPPGVHLGPREIVVVEAVPGASQHVGWLRLQVPLSPLYQGAAIFAAVTAVAAALSMLLAWAFAVGVRRDVARVEHHLDDLAYRDPVTQLFNRHAAAEHLPEYAQHAREHGSGFTVLSFDLDNFKTINDTLGHPIGDAVLREVAGRLQRALQPGARAYRFGGDEFVMLCPCEEGLNDPDRYGRMVRQMLGGMLHIEGREISLSGSAGVARYPHDGDTPEAVLRASDMAMYEAKTRGKNAVVVFDARLLEASQARLEVESGLRTALREGQLRLLYQPIVSLHGGALVGAEALVRWQHPTRGLLGPAEFIDTAEQSGLVVPLGGWVLAEAARQLARWRAQGLDPLRVAVNVSARQLRAGQLLEQLRQAVVDTGLDAARLGLEIELTEHTLVEDLDENLQVLSELRAAGVQIAIDDFGTGLSSLAYLKRLPISKLKIDRSFVAGLPHDASDRAIVGAALSMAQALKLTVVAEGVENAAQRDTLREMGCDLAQGWHFGRPMTAEALAAAFLNAPAAAATPAG